MKRHTTIGRLAHVGPRLGRSAFIVLAMAGFLVPLRAITADQDDSASGATAVVNPDDLREASRATAAFSGELDKSLSAVDFEAAANVMAKILEVDERVFGRVTVHPSHS